MDLSLFNTTSLYEAATDLFKQLNIQLNSNTTGSLPAREILKEHYRKNETFEAIRNTYFIGIVDDSIFREVGLFDERYSYKQALVQAEKNYDGLMLFALELDKHPTRTEISDLTRSFNRISQKMPVGLLLKYENEDEAVISISISERFKYKQNWRQGEKAGKVIILRDIHTKTTHAGHIRILKDLTKPVAVTSYGQLHGHWLEVLDVSILNKRFFQELANWYFWAIDNVSFPDDVEKDKELRNATNLIRLITRIIFIWFIKEKKLVPNKLFRKESLKNIVVDFMKNNKSENFYHAILQNLFFGTLNQVIEDRGFVKEGTFQENRIEYGVKNLFRYSDKFLIPESDVIELFKEIPFLNGGLFDCLDKPDDDGKVIYVDGFSRNSKKQSHIPDYVFFTSENEVDLNEIYGTKNKRYKVQGLINLLESYKFTVAENTPIEEEIALDPELLGKVFENLLASYNPETKTTARKQTGSFYTPREIVNYMVDESLIEYLKEHCGKTKEDFEPRLRDLFCYSENTNPFDEQETIQIIESLNNCKILDPACGSGAFPMGILHKMVHILNKLDNGNKLWKELQKGKAVVATEAAYNIDDHTERKRRLDEIDDVFENNASDYGRKLYLIENCIYGIDIQPIAVQIAKLRFFISLIIDQTKFENRENYGIRSLPNLETKFVAANTLITLEKPQLKTGDIFLNDTFLEIKKLSAQLKEVRHKYFNAKIRDEKQKYQKKDKELRNQISNHLVKVGHTTINAHKIASFDPYDQNHFANWFESEWMFGNDLNTGFDIIIGNPPYVSAVSMARTNEEKAYFRQKYPEATGSYDIYILFLLRSLELSSSSGIYTWIIPNKFLVADYSINTKEKLLQNGLVYSIDVSVFDVFENTSVYPIIIFGSKTSTKEFSEYLLEEYSNLEERKFIKPSKLRDFSTFSDFNIQFSSGATGFEASNIKEYVSEVKTKKSIPFIVSGCIDRYSYVNENVRYMGLKLNNAFIEKPDSLAESKWKLWMNRKIVIAGMTRVIEAVYVDTPLALGVGVYAIHGFERFNPYFLTGVLNSKFLTYYINKKFKDKHLAGGYLAINKSTLEKLPLVTPPKDIEISIIELSEKISNLKASNQNIDTSPDEQRINELIYKLYKLSEKEIDDIESFHFEL